MKRMAVVFLALVLGGCVSSKEIEAKRSELTAAYRVEAKMPEPTPIPAEIVKLIDAKVEEWRAEENAKRVNLGLGIAGKAVAGDYVGGFLALLGLGTALLKAKE